MYANAGVNIEIVKFDAIYAREDDELDYCFELAKALGARAISCEISVKDTKRVGQFADKHKVMVAYHGHAETGPSDWETAFGFATQRRQPGYRALHRRPQHVADPSNSSTTTASRTSTSRTGR